MRYFDEDEAKKLNAQPWQLDLLKANPEYCHWGPHEDYMMNKEQGWNGRIIANSWEEFGPWELDELNECVNFYFEVSKHSETCGNCGGNGYHTDAQRVVNTFYPHQCREFGIPSIDAWNDKITQEECDALIRENRVKEGSTAEEINLLQRTGKGLHTHDGINRSILIKARLERLGLPVYCEVCNGEGYTLHGDAYVSLVLWWLHPRKGCSRGIEVKNIQQRDLPAVKDFLNKARERNAERFSGIDLIK